MKLYSGNVFKYYNASRISFFDNFLVRFTQPEAFEDYQECTPEIVFSCDKDLLRQRAIEALLRNKKVVNEENIAIYIQKIRGQYEKTVNKSYCLLKNELGVLSLGKTPFNSHLWSKYASDGFCVEFDSSLCFFREQDDDPPGTGVLFEVVYSDKPAELNIDALLKGDRKNFLPLEVFYLKRMNWKLEDEVRIIRLRSNAAITLENGTVSLFRIPNSAIKTVYFSQYASNEFIKGCLEKIRITLPHISVYKPCELSFESITLS